MACRPVAGQRLCDNHIYSSRYLVTASQTNMFPRQQLNYNNEKWCSEWCCPCRDVISGTGWELQLDKQRLYKIKKMPMFAISEKAKPDTENIRGLSLAAVKRTAVQVTRQPL
jgi:hypothetical protein